MDEVKGLYTYIYIYMHTFGQCEAPEPPLPKAADLSLKAALRVGRRNPETPSRRLMLLFLSIVCR